MADRRVGLPLPATVKAADMLQKKWDTAGNQPLPLPRTPGRVGGSSVGFADPGDGVTWLIDGDQGGIEDPTYQKLVIAAMTQELTRPNTPKFLKILGDVVYFNADPGQWMPQLYQPFAHFPIPILSDPGNHDGDTTDDPSRTPLDTWMANFCAKTPGQPAADPQDEFGRDTQTQPYCYWTLAMEAAWIIGLYSNVKSGGYLDGQQLAWLTGELKAAPPDVPVLITMHHPPYCADEETEILTPEGWRRHDEIETGATVLTLNHETGKSEWQVATAVSRFSVADEPMVSMEGDTHSSLTTLAHRWPVMHTRSKGGRDDRVYRQEREWTTSEQLNVADSLITGAPCADLPILPMYTDAFVEAVAWFYTEGHIARRYVSAQVSIAQSQNVNPENVDRIRSALTALHGPAVTERMSTGKLALAEPMWREHHYVHREPDYEKVDFWLNTAASQRLLDVAPDRVVSLDFVQALTRKQLELFIETSLAADGWGAYLAQNDVRRLAAFELACILTGRTPHAYTDHFPFRLKDGTLAKARQMIHVSRKALCHIAAPSSIKYAKGPRRTTYTGVVWCPTTPNGTWLARRHGCVYYTGNSIDAFHGGSANMGDDLDSCFLAAGRWPNAVLAGHVHDYQRFTRDRPGGTTTYIVSGNGGYHNLHSLAGNYAPGMDLGNGVTCELADATNWGYLKMTASGGKIAGQYVQVAADGSVTTNADTFTL